MRTICTFLALLVVSLEAIGAQAILVVTNTKAGVTMISKSNYPTVTLKDLDATQFGSNTTKAMIMENARLTNPVISGTFQMLSLTTNKLLATDENGFVVPTTASGGIGTLTGVTNIGDGVSLINNSNGPVPIFKSLTNSDGTVTITDTLTNLNLSVPGLLTLSNGLTGSINLLSNSIPAISNAVAGGSNLSLSFSNGLTLQSNSLAGLSNFAHASSNGAKVISNYVSAAVFTNLTAKGTLIQVGEAGASSVLLYGSIFLGDGTASIAAAGPISIQSAYISTSAGGAYPITVNRMAAWNDLGGGTGALTNIAASIAEGNHLVGVTGGIQTNIDNRAIKGIQAPISVSLVSTNLILDASLLTQQHGTFRAVLSANTFVYLTNGVDGQKLTIEFYQTNTLGNQTVYLTNTIIGGTDITLPTNSLGAGQLTVSTNGISAAQLHYHSASNFWTVYGFVRGYLP